MCLVRTGGIELWTEWRSDALFMIFCDISYTVKDIPMNVNVEMKRGHQRGSQEHSPKI